MMSQVDWRRQQRFDVFFLICNLVLILFSSGFFVRCMKYYQYCNHVKNILVPTVHEPCVCTPYVQEIKKWRALIFNKDKRKSLARKIWNENPIWNWNDSCVHPHHAEWNGLETGIHGYSSWQFHSSRYCNKIVSPKEIKGNGYAIYWINSRIEQG